MGNTIHVIVLLVIILVSVFLIWDGLFNNGNMFWNQMFATIKYSDISYEEWEQQYNEHEIVQAFMQKYPDAVHHQELDFGFKRLFYVYQNGTDIIELTITKGPHSSHFRLYCESETHSDSIPIRNSMQLDTFSCIENKK